MHLNSAAHSEVLIGSVLFAAGIIVGVICLLVYQKLITTKTAVIRATGVEHIRRVFLQIIMQTALFTGNIATGAILWHHHKMAATVLLIFAAANLALNVLLAGVGAIMITSKMKQRKINSGELLPLFKTAQPARITGLILVWGLTLLVTAAMFHLHLNKGATAVIAIVVLLAGFAFSGKRDRRVALFLLLILPIITRISGKIDFIFPAMFTLGITLILYTRPADIALEGKANRFINYGLYTAFLFLWPFCFNF
jgi:hypothetical protein